MSMRENNSVLDLPNSHYYICSSSHHVWCFSLVPEPGASHLQTGRLTSDMMNMVGDLQGRVRIKDPPLIWSHITVFIFPSCLLDQEQK